MDINTILAAINDVPLLLRGAIGALIGGMIFVYLPPYLAKKSDKPGATTITINGPGIVQTGNSNSAVISRSEEPRIRFHIEGAGLINFDDGFRTGVTVKYRNAGNANAYDVTSDVSTTILEYPFSERTTFPSASQTHESKGVLAPGQEVFGSAQFDSPLTHEQVSQVVDGSKVRLVVAGRLSFRYANGPKCTQRFMFHLGGRELQRIVSDKIAGRPIGGVPWVVADRFNDINSECE